MLKAYVDGALVDVTQEEVDATRYQRPATEGQIRSQRDQLIAATDTWALSDQIGRAHV